MGYADRIIAASDDKSEAIERLQYIIDAQADLIGYYEEDCSRSEYEDEEIPRGLAELELALREARDDTNSTQ